MRKVLLVHYFYKPFSSNQSFRYESIIENYHNENMRIDILTSKHKGLPDVEETECGFIYRVNSKLLIKDLEKVDKDKNSNKERKNLKVKLTNIVKQLVYKVVWPDFAGLWIFPAIIKGRQLARVENYDLIISGSFPFSSHIVGYFIKGKNKESRWVVDYLDPFSIIKHNENPSNNTKIFRGLNKIVEKQINRSADKIIILKEAFTAFKDYFPDLLEKTTIAPPMLGINPNKFYNTKPIDFSNKGVNIVFIGSLYKSIRNPEPILRIIQELSNYDCDIYVHFVGDLKDCKDLVQKYNTMNRIKIITHGKVSRDKAISFMKGADVLLNISNSSQVQLPGKVVEYAFSKKKIINHSLNENSNTSLFFEEIGLSDKVFNIIGNNCSIDSLYDFITSSVVEKEIDMEKFLPENIGKIYFE
ncbi:hypothetical protein [Neobacillus drentensis]|uniref:hypothetical protein n=1 Tax=Neobacillus drentensis TaxID=220684 RepID=UPI002862160E|nr:hypothetical protein [Neobacillus drentensis]MDR7238765.1 hypothetical protein [Neobacillus drentensis]